MRVRIDSVLIVTKVGHPQAQTLARDIAAWLAERGAPHDIRTNDAQLDAVVRNWPGVPASPLACPSGEGADGAPEAPACTGVDVGADCGQPLVLALGGDGTFLSAARRLIGKRAQILGVNLGKVGFLTDVPSHDWRRILEKALEDGVRVEERPLLGFRIERQGQPVCEGEFVNDLVISRGAVARLMRLGLTVGGEKLVSFRADGIIAATSTGSTAYCASAGGPIALPDLDVCLLAPICPFLATFRPLILPSTTEVRIAVEEAKARLYATVDGQQLHALETGDDVVIRKAARGLRVARVDGATFIAKLRDRGFHRDG